MRGKVESTSDDLWEVRVKCLKNGLLNQQRFYKVTGGPAYRWVECGDAKKWYYFSCVWLIKRLHC